MPLHIQETSVPPASRISRELAGAYFADSYVLRNVNPGLSAMAMYLAVAGNTPGWIDGLMNLRNRVVKLFGLKDLGALGAVPRNKTDEEFAVGDRIGIFTLMSVSEDEVVLGDADRHLRVQVSVCKLANSGTCDLAVTTVVHVHNTLGRVYMAFVAPIHRRIVPAMLSRAPSTVVAADLSSPSLPASD